MIAGYARPICGKLPALNFPGFRVESIGSYGKRGSVFLRDALGALILRKVENVSQHAGLRTPKAGCMFDPSRTCLQFFAT